MPAASSSSAASLPTIVFDLDGTLVDSAPDLVAALNATLARDGLAPLPLAEARRFVGGGGRVLIRQGLAAAGREVSDARLEEMFAAFIAHYEQHLVDETRFYLGAEAALDQLAARGHLLAVCTNKFERLARRLLDGLGATRRFAAIVGQDTFQVAKPNGATLKLTVERAGGDPAHVVMIGDTATDVTTARNAGAPVIAVDFGYATQPVADLAPDRIISHFSELVRALDALAASTREKPEAPRV